MLTARNRYVARSHLSEAKVRQIVRLVALDLEATKVAQITGVSRRTVNRLCHALRVRMAQECEAHAPIRGTVELDESYFGRRRIRGKRGRGAGGKTVVFGIFKRNGRVYTQIVPDAKQATLRAVIRGRVALASVLHSDGWIGYDGLVDLGYRKHFRVEHRDSVFVSRRGVHINGIESFWSFSKRRLAKFNGIPNASFPAFLKECEFRFNNRHGDLYRTMLRSLRRNPLAA